MKYFIKYDKVKYKDTFMECQVPLNDPLPCKTYSRR